MELEQMISTYKTTKKENHPLEHCINPSDGGVMDGVYIEFKGVNLIYI